MPLYKIEVVSEVAVLHVRAVSTEDAQQMARKMWETDEGEWDYVRMNPNDDDSFEAFKEEDEPDD